MNLIQSWLEQMRRYWIIAVVSMFSSLICERCILFCRSILPLRRSSGMPLIWPDALSVAFSSITLRTRSSVEKPLSKMSCRILKPTYLPARSCIAMCT